MSKEQLKSFLSKAKDDQSIQEQLMAANSTEDVAGIAKQHGHEFTTDKVNQLSEDDLQEVSGGSETAGEIIIDILNRVAKYTPKGGPIIP